MSHVSTVNVEVKDLEALKQAVKELGATFIEGKRNYAWYGRHVGDYPLPKGFTKEELGKCDHVIHIDGVEYEVGVVRKGDAYRLLFDFWGPGAGIVNKFGQDCKKLVQAYGVTKAMNEARKKGLRVQKFTKNDGTIQLRIGGIR